MYSSFMHMFTDESGSHSSVVKKLKDERDTLQAMSVKLSAELSRYQSKFRPLSQSEVSHCCSLKYSHIIPDIE